MRYLGWIFDPQVGQWQQVCSNNIKNRATEHVAVELDELRLRDDYGLVMVMNLSFG
jgi:hypothetical protein